MKPMTTSPAEVGRSATPPTQRKAPARPTPERSPEHEHLTLEALREYRKVLAAEESRVSYWRRILQARLDLLVSGADSEGDTLRPVLTDQRVGAGRRALVEVMPVDDIPPLPDLASLWDRVADLDDPRALASLTKDLTAAERQLSEYRSVLHRRIAAATSELIARYRDEPTLCLSALPLKPERRSVPA
ncbi:MAG TPA: hypothetical protein VMZ11_03010 [Mycobacteriales bacterium]|nr:hypothetical protein [Mycobacteriales bacterium]